MFLPQSDISDSVQRQRNQKQELSKALLKNQTKLTQVQQEIQFLSLPLYTDYGDECERLDDEIDKLRRICHVMLNEIENIKRAKQPPAVERQPVRPAPPPPPHPPPRTRPNNLFSKQMALPPHSPLTPQSPAPMHGQQQTYPCQKEHQSPEVLGTNTALEVCPGEQPWQCSMCTFQNHPLLNKCECCENVRILPGSVRIKPTRPLPPPPYGSRSAPQTPGTPLLPLVGSSSAHALTLPIDYNQTDISNSSSESNLSQFVGDVII